MLGSENRYDPTMAPTLARVRMISENGRTGLYRSKSGSVRSTTHQTMITRLVATALVAASTRARADHRSAATPPATAVAPINVAPASA